MPTNRRQLFETEHWIELVHTLRRAHVHATRTQSSIAFPNAKHKNVNCTLLNACGRLVSIRFNCMQRDVNVFTQNECYGRIVLSLIRPSSFGMEIYLNLNSEFVAASRAAECNAYWHPCAPHPLCSRFICVRIQHWRTHENSAACTPVEQ